MRAVVLNKHSGAVGLPGGVTLPSGESVTMDLDPDDYKLLKGWECVEVSDVDRPKGGGDSKPAGKATPKGRGESYDALGAPPERG